MMLLAVIPVRGQEQQVESQHTITIGGSVYGGGRRGAILESKVITSGTLTGGEDAGSTTVVFYEGTIGNDDSEENGLGNIFGGGYGPAARVMKTKVQMFGGTVMNSLYGGGEIAAVGWGVMDPPIDKIPILREVKRQGHATVELYRGKVKCDVFGGGCGFTLTDGDGSLSQERLYTDGYVFGSANVCIYGGEIGTLQNIENEHGNVFGGGNVGFFYSGNDKMTAGVDQNLKNKDFLDKGKTYYVIPKAKKNYNQAALTSEEWAKCKDDDFFADANDATSVREGELSIACEVLIEPWCRVKEAVTIHNQPYVAGDYVKTEDLDFLTYKNKNEATEVIVKENVETWQKLETDGITIWNAVFAGGNVSTGDDKVYAETTTVYGNVAVTINDLYYRDLVSIGTEIGSKHVGGIYGDGNLTFADGYRELSLNCYGTDYYNLKSEVTQAEFDALNAREKDYYQMKYKCTETYPAGDEPKYKAGDVISESIYKNLPPAEQGYWQPAGFRSKYAGRLMNTIQRADFAGVFGSRLVLQGAMDRVLTKEGDQLKFEDYTINRVGELSFNKQAAPGAGENSSNCYGNYFGIYNQVNYLGALTSDVRFYEDDWEDTEDTDVDDPDMSYYDYKKYIIDHSGDEGGSKTDIKFKNLGTSKNLIALASGVALELKQEPTEDAPNNWGIITGVIQLDLLNVTQGEGGGFVYARNEHGTASRYKINGVDYVRKFLSDYNNTGKAATHEEYEYNKNALLSMQTSGNFVKSKKNIYGEVQYIVDDCYPTHNLPSSSGEEGGATKAHYWYIRGSKYAYNLYVSAFTGAAKLYQSSMGILFPTGTGTLQLIDVMPGYYCNIGENDQPIEVNDVEYRRGDPISWWDYDNYLVKTGDPNKDKFIVDTDQYALDHYNNMSHDNGFVLAFEFDNNNLSYYNPTSYDNPNIAGKGPSFTTQTTDVYGQYSYKAGDLIAKTEVDKFSSKEGLARNRYPDYKLCVQSLQLNSGGSLLLTKGELVAIADIPGLVKKYMSIKLEKQEDQFDVDDYPDLKTEALAAINTRLDEYYQVTADGNYGGTNYTAGTKYDALDGWCSLSQNDRESNKWSYNDDALDVLNNASVTSHKALQNVTLNSSPQAIVSLYMSRDSRLMTLNENKNLTVHFKYTTSDNDEEHHYINIIIEFKDELPDVGKLEEPDIVLPGTKIAFKQPPVVASYSIAGGGWEYYKTEEAATAHVGGTKFENGHTPFYWYQDGYYVNYYAETMYGRSYSENTVQIHVANSHDLKDVIDASNHLMIDKAGARDAKIYINDYTEDNESGVDLLKDLFDISLNNSELNERVKGLANLDIILRTDLAPKVDNSWTTSIGSDVSQCFEGKLHGDGYTISGLSASLFNKLCGNVYNLGVTGSFTSSGIADESSGRIENCWVSTTGTPGNNTKPLADGGTIVNSYYNKKYSSSIDGAIKKNDNAFYNGNVAYEVNGYHLKHTNRASEGTLTNLTAHYVENRYADGDFIYADGTIPKPYLKEEDPRWDSENSKYKALDDDYIFFGQRLTYGYRSSVEHEDKPSRINEDMVNRVYRAPAYFQNATAQKAYYNKDAIFAAKSADGLHDVYPGMTAIDFTGYNTTSTILDHDGLTDFFNADLTKNLLVYANYDNDSNEDSEDDDDLLTRLLDNKEPAFASYKKATVRSGDDTAITGDGSVAAVAAAETIANIKGHVVFKKSSSYQTNSDHYLVDRQDYFAPISYQMASGKRMWYQRQPDNYAEKIEETGSENTIYKSIGWESLSLPFTAELVTTQKKGEITHFYAGEGETKGHEYWLRRYLGTGQLNSVNNIFEANFQYPDVGSSDKTVANTFLWDYYYSKENRQDANTDQYQPGSTQVDYHYYQNPRSYTNYPRLAANTPYIVGFPGETYYEFDLSGQFEAQHAKVKPYVFGAQTITFATTENATIPVSSNAAVVGTGEIDETHTQNNYDFVPCFVAKDKSELGSNVNVFLLNAIETQENDPAGSIFEQVSDGDYTVPFRAYFTSTSSAAPARGVIFAYGDKAEIPIYNEPIPSEEIIADGKLIIRAGQGRITVTSYLEETVPISIVNISGITLRSFNIAPGETVVTPVHLGGIYIVNHKKIVVRMY